MRNPQLIRPGTQEPPVHGDDSGQKQRDTLDGYLQARAVDSSCIVIRTTPEQNAALCLNMGLALLPRKIKRIVIE